MIIYEKMMFRNINIEIYNLQIYEYSTIVNLWIQLYIQI